MRITTHTLILIALSIIPIMQAKAFQDYKISLEEYIIYAQTYPSVIINKSAIRQQNPAKFIVDEEELTTCFILQQTEHHYIINITNNIDTESSDSILLTQISIPDTTTMYVYSNKYSNPLDLYTCPDTSCSKITFEEYINEELYIIDFNGPWLKVQFIHNGNLYIGWLSPDSYCSNPYSTCS